MDFYDSRHGSSVYIRCVCWFSMQIFIVSELTLVCDAFRFLTVEFQLYSCIPCMSYIFKVDSLQFWSEISLYIYVFSSVLCLRKWLGCVSVLFPKLSLLYCFQCRRSVWIALFYLFLVAYGISLDYYQFVFAIWLYCSTQVIDLTSSMHFPVLLYVLGNAFTVFEI